MFPGLVVHDFVVVRKGFDFLRVHQQLVDSGMHGFEGLVVALLHHYLVEVVLSEDQLVLVFP